MLDVQTAMTPLEIQHEANLTNALNKTGESDEEDVKQLFYTVAIVQSTIALIGIIFNALNIYVLVNLVRRRRGVSPTYHLLIAMGVADLLTLFFIAFFFLNVYTRTPPLLINDLKDEHHDFYHVLHYIWMFPGNVFAIASNWLVVATTVFRFLAVAFPMNVCQWCTLRRIRLSILLIFALSLLINVPDWFTVEGYTRNDSRVRIKDTPLYNNMDEYVAVFHVFQLYLPFIIDLILVVFLIINLNNTTSSMANSITDGNAAAREREHRKIGIMLIAIVIWFLVCNAPVLVYHVIRDTSPLPKSEVEKTEFIQKISLIKDFSPILNHGGNIIFYCLCNNTYRRMFVNTLLCRKKPARGQSMRTTMTQASSRSGKISSLSSTRSGHTRRSIINKIDRLGILPSEETRKETVLWNKMGFNPDNDSSSFDPNGINILVSDPLIEMYHSSR